MVDVVRDISHGGCVDVRFGLHTWGVLLLLQYGGHINVDRICHLHCAYDFPFCGYHETHTGYSGRMVASMARSGEAGGLSGELMRLCDKNIIYVLVYITCSGVATRLRFQLRRGTYRYAAIRRGSAAPKRITDTFRTLEVSLSRRRIMLEYSPDSGYRFLVFFSPSFS